MSYTTMKSNYADKIYENFLDMYGNLFGRKCALPFNKLFYNLALRGLGIQNYKNFNISGESKFIETFFKLNANKKELTIIDVGANRGDYVRLLLNKNKGKNLQIIAVEPDPAAFKRLKRNFFGQKIKLFNYACDEKTSSRFFYSDGAGGVFSSFYKNALDVTNISNSLKIKIDTIKLDELIRKEKLKSIDLLKVDTEGSEINVLKGCVNAIKRNKIELIQFEFNKMGVDRRIFLKDFLLFLKGYSFYRLLPHSVVKLEKYNPLFWEIFAFQNFIVVRKDIVKEFEKSYAK